MLIIDTKKGQSIRIANRYMLSVKEIDLEKRHVTLSFFDETTYLTHFYMNVGMSLEILDDVHVMLTKITKGQHIEAVLGFKAPRQISIRGTWIRKNESIQLTSLTDRELCHHADLTATTKLEKELVHRFCKGRYPR